MGDELRQRAARHFATAFGETSQSPMRLLQRKAQNVEITVVKKQILIVLAAGLLMASVAVVSATEMKQSFGSKMLPSVGQPHNIYAGHSSSKVRQHAALSRAPWHNMD